MKTLNLNERLEQAEKFLDRGKNRRYFNEILIGISLAFLYPNLNKITEYKIPAIQEVREEKKEFEPYRGRRNDTFSLESITDDSLKTAIINQYEKIEDRDIEKIVSRIKKFRSIFDRVSEDYDLDPILMKGLAYQESSMDPRKISSKGAVGLGQIRPKFAYGLVSRYVKNNDIKMELMKQRGRMKEKLMVPKNNLELNAGYLSALIRMYDGNVVLGLAAYNMGPAAVNEILRMRNLKPSEANYHKIKGLLKPETKEFIPKVFSKALKLRESYASSERNKSRFY